MSSYNVPRILFFILILGINLQAAFAEDNSQPDSFDNPDLKEAKELLLELERDIENLKIYLLEEKLELDETVDPAPQKENIGKDTPISDEPTSPQVKTVTQMPVKKVSEKNITAQKTDLAQKGDSYLTPARQATPEIKKDEFKQLKAESFAKPTTYTSEDLLYRNAVLELERLETALIEGRNITRFLSVNTQKVRLERVSSNQVKLFAVGLGSTVIHLWDDDGRRTLKVTVRQRGIKISKKLRDLELESERVESLQIRISTDTSKTHSRSKSHTNDFELSDTITTISVTGGSPYGDIYSTLSARQKDTSTRQDYDISEFIFNLKGKDFSLNLGDSFADLSELSLNFTHFQGVDYEAKFGDRINYEILSGAIGNRLWGNNLFFGEGDRYFHALKLDYLLTEYMTLKFIDVEARGAAGFPDRVLSWGTETKIKDLVIETELAGNDEDDYSYSVMGTYRKGQVSLESIYRDYAKDFRTIYADIPFRGQRGIYNLLEYDPYDTISILVNYDYYENRFQGNPARPGYFNTNFDASTRIILPMRMDLSLRAFARDLRGSSSPSVFFGEGVNLSKDFDMPYLPFLKSGFIDFEASKFRNNTSRSADYNNIRVSTGLSMELIDNIRLELIESFNFRRFIEDGHQTSPKKFTARINYDKQIFDLPLHSRVSLRYERETGVAEDRAIYTGEESISGEAELRYVPNPNLEFYIRGRVTEIDGVNDGTLDRLETSIFAGASYYFDTGIRLEYPGKIEGNVFHDLDNDGVFTEGTDRPYQDVEVTLDDKKSVTTDSEGYFLFKGVTPGEHTVRTDMTKFPKGFIFTTTNPQSVVVSQLETKEVTFGVTTRTLFSGYVFNDLNTNQIYDENIDEGVRNVRVFISENIGVMSNRLGYFVFKNVADGTYRLKVDVKTLPQGVLPRSPKGVPITIEEGGIKQFNFPLYSLRAILGKVFLDKNQNGQLDAGEPGVKGVKLRLGDKIALSGSDGGYIFRKLPMGKAQVELLRESLPDSMTPSLVYKKSFDLPKEPHTESEAHFALIEA